MKHVIIINPIAGVNNKIKTIAKIVEESFKGLDYEVYYTKSIGDAKYFVRDYLQHYKPEDPNDDKVRFYACGGDGTLNEVANGTIGFKNAEFTCYPIGSGNDFVKYFGKISDFLNFKSLINGTVKCVDALKLNGRYVCNIFNIGLDAKVAHLQKKYKKLPLVSGKGAYNLGVVGAILSKINYKYKIKLDGEEVYNDKVALCAICNGICYGGGYYCAPVAKVDDNLLDLCFIKKVGRITIAKLIKIYKAGKHLEDEKIKPYVFYKTGKVVEIETEKPLYYSVDGEMGRTDKIVIEIIPDCMNFVVPNLTNNF